MFAASQSHLQHQSSEAAAPSSSSSSGVDALKRNTDCVYFLASPLTCKKGSECEYRHSNYARVNPKDCYYWLNGNCLNPKCGFRHPPLDGLVGPQGTASSGSSVPSTHNVVALTAHAPSNAPSNSGKQAVPCHFFQKGLCIKGDKCAFLHGPNHTTVKAPQPKALTPVIEPQQPRKTSGGVNQCGKVEKIPLSNFSKAVEAPLEPKDPPPRNSVGVEIRSLPPKGFSDEVVRYKTINPLLINDGNSSHLNHSQLSHVADDQGFRNGREVDDTFRESSPGFDVLVDDELEDSVYNHENRYGRTGLHDGKNLISVDEFDMAHSADYGSVHEANRERFSDAQGYDPYDYMQGQHDWLHHRASSERTLVAPVHVERRYSKANGLEHIEESDLRHRLSKQRRASGLKSVVSHDLLSSSCNEEPSDRGFSLRDLHDFSTGSRLRGRIKLPRRSPSNESDQTRRETDWGRGRMFSGRPHISSHERIHDRVSYGLGESVNNEGRTFRGPRTRRDTNYDGSDFASPKSLEELRGAKNAERNVDQSLKKRKHSTDNQPSQGDLSFNGPLPLSEILKRKRGAGGSASGGVVDSVNNVDSNQKERKSMIGGSSSKAEAETKNSSVLENKDESKPAEESIVDVHGEASELPNLNEREIEDGMMGVDGMEDQEYEGDYQGDGDYEYEQDEGDYAYEGGENGEEGQYGEEGEEYEGENLDGGQEYADEEDGDNFAKKIGVTL